MAGPLRADEIEEILRAVEVLPDEALTMTDVPSDPLVDTPVAPLDIGLPADLPVSAAARRRHAAPGTLPQARR